MVREGKPKGFFYLDHRTVDAKCNIITDSHITAANIHDSLPYLERLDVQREKFDFNVESVGLDAGYFTPPLCRGLVKREIYGVIGYRRPSHKKGYFYKKEYKYAHSTDSYTCPAGENIPYSTTTREGYRTYKSDPKVCINCPHINKCTRSSNHVKVITRHVWEDYKDEVNSHRFENIGKEIYVRRKETIERSFADSKQLHGLRYARFRNKERVSDQCLLTSACQNMKKIAMALS